VQSYLELAGSLCFATGIGSAALVWKADFLGVAAGGFGSALISPRPANVIATIFWHRAYPLAIPSKMGLGSRGWSIPTGCSALSFFLSLLSMAAFLSLAKQDAVDRMWMVAAVVVTMRLVIMPLMRSLRLTGILLLAKNYRINDWLLRLYPSIMTANGALLQNLPWKVLAPPA